jgi:hypothetical protein
MTMATAHPDNLTQALAELLDMPAEEIPPLVGLSWVVEHFGVTGTSVQHAVKQGKLPAISVPDSHGRVLAWKVRPADALLIWGHKLRKDKPMNLYELMSRCTTEERTREAVEKFLSDQKDGDTDA